MIPLLPGEDICKCESSAFSPSPSEQFPGVLYLTNKRLVFLKDPDVDSGKPKFFKLRKKVVLIDVELISMISVQRVGGGLIIKTIDYLDGLLFLLNESVETWEHELQLVKADVSHLK